MPKNVRGVLIAAAAAAIIAAVVIPLMVPGGGNPGHPTAASSSSSSSSSYSVPATNSQTRVRTALAVLDDLRAGRYRAIRRGFDATMLAALSEAQLGVGWQQFQSQFGAFRSHGTPTSTELGSDWVVRVPLTMSHLPGELRVTYDAAGRIAGLYLLRQGVPLGSAGGPAVEPTATTDGAAQKVLTKLVGADYAAVEAAFDPTMKSAVTQEQLRSGWEQLTGRLGAFRSYGIPFVVPLAAAVLYDFPLQLANGPAHLQVAIGADGAVAGLYLKPGRPTGTFGH